MAYYIAHASIDERGKASGGQAGDQTGKEVCIRQWYSGNTWNVVLRPVDKTIGKKAVNAAVYLANSNLVGYNQYQRNTLREALQKISYNYKALTGKYDTDCSAFVTVVYECAGWDMSSTCVSLGNGHYNSPVTQTMRKTFVATGHFTALTDQKYLTSAAYLEPGDILLRESGHTALYIGTSTTGFTDVNSTRQTVAPVYTTDTGTYTVATQTDPLNCRAEPNTSSVIVGKFPKGTTVTTSKKTNCWKYVTNGIITGWVSDAYLTPVTPAATTKASVNLEELYTIIDEVAAYTKELVKKRYI